jgi:hypothetical protein
MLAKNHDVAIRHASESAEHYTPSFIVEAARKTLGAIDLDPASCAEANVWIKATKYFTRESDGFKLPWHGRVLLNAPGGLSDDLQRPVKPKCKETGSCGIPPGHTHTGTQASQKKWWFKLVSEYMQGRVTSAIFVCFSIELLQNTQVNIPRVEVRNGSMSGNCLSLIPLDFPICFPSRRVSYIKPGGAAGMQPPHASCIIYLPPKDMIGDPGGTLGGAKKFEECFAQIGRTKM